MTQQFSFQASERTGMLYLVPTPIGNLEDITFRAVRILQEADYILAEDTRQTKKLTQHYQIETYLESYHEHNKRQKQEKILQWLTEGKQVAMVSDAGTPLVSDPGNELVQECIKKELPVVPLPGANALLPALTASGLGGGFYFHGFLPRKKKDIRSVLHRLPSGVPVILYESPYRLLGTIRFLHEEWGDGPAVVARELTKKHEEFVRGSLLEAAAAFENREVKGECVLIVEKPDLHEPEEDVPMEEEVRKYVEEGASSKEAIKKTAQRRNVKKQEVYAAYHGLNKP
ncbi:16S rRNA (cytidine(1402)-2'-O)-methyltransferase [Marinococcus halophilus]|uniref:Ribosomal RNA small subunit methyltransferase I n=1 Tax=Marinococcus halophilus TaxID=1371 RepID=A0A510Y8R7_MARHA|nr:16S rRNA (cytidine(1402)-2'-O)-methyltransferase [Marinococcus halophilus]OZT79217.1 16S rRNA (cytidine(1402)-2'-O)-methyltransferase [Marinococcus halophilus]GEK59778.1 ribosomal RNA small subunit methyltransferase I [Marinococcus halophilus]